LGRAMVRRPSVYLMDEPLTGLDAPLRRQLRRELKQWQAATKATVVYVTHDQGEALLLGDRVAVMNGGRLQQVGTPREVYQTPNNRFVAGFVGNPPMNLIEGELSNDGPEGPLMFRAGAWTFPAPEVERLRTYVGQRVLMGIRPEHLAIGAAPTSKQQAEKQKIDIAGVVRFTESAGDLHLADVRPAGNKVAAAEVAGAEESVGEARNDRLTVKWNGADVPCVGDTVHLEFEAERVHWFDRTSGANLTLP